MITSACEPIDWAAWLAAVATVAGVVLVWLQLRGLRQQVVLQTYAEYTRRYAEIVHRLPEDVNSPTFVLVGRKDYDQTMRAMRCYFDLSFEEWDLWKKGLIEDRFWNTWRAGIKTAISKPAFKQAWAIVKVDSDFGDEFGQLLRELAGPSLER